MVAGQQCAGTRAAPRSTVEVRSLPNPCSVLPRCVPAACAAAAKPNAANIPSGTYTRFGVGSIDLPQRRLYPAPLVSRTQAQHGQGMRPRPRALVLGVVCTRPYMQPPDDAVCSSDVWHSCAYGLINWSALPLFLLCLALHGPKTARATGAVSKSQPSVAHTARNVKVRAQFRVRARGARPAGRPPAGAISSLCTPPPTLRLSCACLPGHADSRCSWQCWLAGPGVFCAVQGPGELDVSSCPPGANIAFNETLSQQDEAHGNMTCGQSLVDAFVPGAVRAHVHVLLALNESTIMAC